MTAGIQLRAIGASHVDRLIEMYDRFDPLGAALGLPPFALEARGRWIRNAVGQIANIGAFSPKGDVVGHSFLAGSNPPGSAEIAVFVHQEFRRKGVGTALLTNALEFGRALQLDAVWAVTDTANRAALRLLERCGFRLRQSDVDIAEFEIDLSVRPRHRVLPAEGRDFLVRKPAHFGSPN